MRPRAKELEQTRKAKGRLRMIQHYEQATRNVSRTCRTPARARWKATLAPITPAPPHHVRRPLHPASAPAVGPRPAGIIARAPGVFPPERKGGF